jgi:hypothetical protein
VPEDKIAIVGELNEAFSAFDWPVLRAALEAGTDWDDSAVRLGRLGELLRERIDPSIEIDVSGTGVLFPEGTTFAGHAGWFSFWKTWLGPWEEFSFVMSDPAVVGDDVVFDVRLTARGAGSGVSIEWPQCQAWTVRDGKVTRLRVWPDRETAMAALAA